MPPEPGPYERFAIIRLDSNVALNGLNVMAQGSWPDVAQHIPDNRFVKQKLRIINDSAVVERKQKARETALDARAGSLKEAEASFQADVDLFKHELLQDFVSKLDALAARMDAFEQERAKDPEDDLLPLPPGSQDEPDAGGVPLSYKNVPTSYVHSADEPRSRVGFRSDHSDRRNRRTSVLTLESKSTASGRCLRESGGPGALPSAM